MSYEDTQSLLRNRKRINVVKIEKFSTKTNTTETKKDTAI